MVIGRDSSCSEEQPADDHVEECPENIDRRRRQTLPGRLRERRRKRVAGDTVDEVGNGVSKERSGKEAGYGMGPGHG